MEVERGGREKIEGREEMNEGEKRGKERISRKRGKAGKTRQRGDE